MPLVGGFGCQKRTGVSNIKYPGPGLAQSDINYRADWWENDTAELRLAGAQQCLVIISDMKHGEARGSGRSYQTIYSSSSPSPPSPLTVFTPLSQ